MDVSHTEARLRNDRPRSALEGEKHRCPPGPGTTPGYCIPLNLSTLLEYRIFLSIYKQTRV